MVAVSDIEVFSQKLASEYKPDKIVLFGSFARGEAGNSSDVDLLVVMKHAGSGLQQAVQMIRRLKPRFSVDLIVRSSEELERRLRQNDFFLNKAVNEGRVLYEAVDA